MLEELEVSRSLARKGLDCIFRQRAYTRFGARSEFADPRVQLNPRLSTHFGLTVTEIASSSSAPCFKDENVSIYAVPLAPSSRPLNEPAMSPGLKRKRAEDETDLDVGVRKQPRQSDGPDHPTERAVDDSAPGPSWLRSQRGKLWQNLETNLGFAKDKSSAATDRAPFDRVIPPCLDPLPLSLAYICVGAQVRGKFDAARAGVLGVEGKDRRRLTQGESVTLADGTVITPEMLIAPSLPSTVSNSTWCSQHMAYSAVTDMFRYRYTFAELH